MNIKTALKPFKRRLNAEAILRASLSAGLIAAGVAILLEGAHILLPWLIPELWIILIFAGVFAVSMGLLFLLAYRPTKQSLARRLDELGLSERVETMLELEQSDTPAAKLQREDTVNRLRQVPPKSLRLRVSKRQAILCAVLLTCAATLFFVPEINLFSRHDVIDRLHQLLDDSEVTGDLHDDLSQIIDDLEDQLKDAKNEQDYAEDLKDAQESVQNRVDQEITKDEIGAALQKFEDLRALGEAIADGNQYGVSKALDGLQELMAGDPIMQRTIADQIQDALEMSGTSPEDSLHQALKNMENGLRDTAQALERVMDRAEAEIHAALRDQHAAGVLGQQMEDALKNARPSGSEAESQPPSSQESTTGDASENPNGDQPGEGPAGDNEGDDKNGPAGDGSGQGNGLTHMKDMISDPSSGDLIQYGDVYAAYMADFLQQAENGTLPPKVVEAMNAYLESLRK